MILLRPSPFSHPKPKRLPIGRKAVTICAATLAQDSKGIVCIADKALSYGDHIQWDSDTAKIFKLNRDCLLMFAGGEMEGSSILANLIEKTGELGGKSKQDSIKACEESYKLAMEGLIGKKFLAPRLLSKDRYVSAITAGEINKYIHSLAREIDKFDMECDVLICGFDQNRNPFIVSLVYPGIATDMTQTGFHAIGSGWDKAVSRLLFSSHKRKHQFSRVLYDIFDAKAYAEMAAGVGYEWDAVVLIGRPIGYCDVSKEIKELTERAWAKFNRSPFEKYNKKEDLPLPPKDWRKKLENFINSEIVAELRKLEEEVERQKAAKQSAFQKSAQVP